MANPLGKKLASSFINLILRRATLLTVNFITINLILARVLPVSTIGIFNIANSILAFFAFFSDIGLAAALIQKKEITDEDLSTTFTIQEILAFAISVGVFLGAGKLAALYRLDASSVNLIRALAVSFFLTSLKVIPSVLLERELQFGKLVIVEVFENILFNGILIALTFKGLGIDAFTISTLMRTTGGFLLIFTLSPWKVRFRIHRPSIKSLLNFGLPFQLNSLLALLKDRLVPLVIAKMIGPVGVGYITWSQNMAFIPLEIMNIITRITFPAFSRLQDDSEGLREMMEQSLFFLALFFYPLSFGLLATAPSLINHVVSIKWLPALPLIYLFSIGAIMATFSSPFTNFLNATGRIKITLKLMVMWTVLEWALSPLLTIFYGYFGVGIAASIISITSLIPIAIVKKTTKVTIIPHIWKPLVSALFMAVIVNILAGAFVFNLPSLLIVVVLGGGLYFLFICILAWEEMRDALRSLLKA